MARLPFAAAGLAVVIFFGCSQPTSQKTAPDAGGVSSQTGDREAGEQIFRTNCSSCHGATGLEGGIGPSLRRESARMDFSATESWIKDPQPPMPKLYPEFLSDAQVRDVTAYVEHL